ncbi:MAG: HAMP domain-containing protein [Myxococcales bacterium]|nr:HAMP domain-containing protein [Myxococcales bacterium]
MRLGAQIRLFILLTAIVPLLVLAFTASRVAREELTAALTREQVASAAQLATSLDQALTEREQVLAAQLGNFQLDVAPDDARLGFLVSTWRLLPEVAIAMLLDADGQDAAPPIFAETEADAQGHDLVDGDRLSLFRAALPAPGAGVVRGAAYFPDGNAEAVIPLTILSPRHDGMALGVELSTGPLRRFLTQVAGDDRAALLVDSDGTVLLAAGNSRLVDPARLRPLLGSVAADARVDDEVVVATSRLPGRDLVAVVAAPASGTDAVLLRVLQPTWYIGVVSLVAALAAGTMLGRSITAPVLSLRSAAQKVGEGDLSTRLRVEGRSELAELSTSFNQMTDRLEANRAEIDAKNQEIEAFNRELQARVDERTRQLREAQARLVESSQLAAVAEMSAGLAHELNNPLAGILGIVQLVKAQRADSGDAALLSAAEGEALRCKEIVGQLLRFTAASRPAGEREVVDLGALVRDVCALAASSFRQRDVTLEFDHGALPARILGPTDELGRAFSQLLGALRTAAAPGATLRITMRVSPEANEVELRLELDHLHDNQDDWRASSVGLWAARRVLSAEGWALGEAATGTGRAWRASVALAAGRAV